MLCKEVCIRCINGSASRWKQTWDDFDDYRWSILDEVGCPSQFLPDYEDAPDAAKSKYPPPDWCPRAFEHAVAAGESNAV